MFPRLQFLLVQDNELYAVQPLTSSAAATVNNTEWVVAILPESWTDRAAPRKFPQLETLVLYPGNDKICFLPESAEGTFLDVNGGESH
jgi:hypothetical protein